MPPTPIVDINSVGMSYDIRIPPKAPSGRIKKDAIEIESAVIDITLVVGPAKPNYRPRRYKVSHLIRRSSSVRERGNEPAPCGWWRDLGTSYRLRHLHRFPSEWDVLRPEASTAGQLQDGEGNRAIRPGRNGQPPRTFYRRTNAAQIS